MKTLIIQENGRHEKNRNFRECFCLQRAFINNKVDCDIWGLNHVNFNEKIDFNKYDIVLICENYNFDWIPNLSNINKYKIIWAIDAHCQGIDLYKRIYTENKCNLMLQSTKYFVDSKSVWFPNGFDESIIYPFNIEKKYDIGFCGNILNRKPLLNYIENNFNLKQDIFVIGPDMVKAINSYKIHFNKNISVDINCRNFETIGCKTLLLTNYDSQYNNLGFKDGINCLIYNSFNELHDKIKYILNNENKRKEIEEAGYILSKKHTYTNRISHLLNYLKDKI